MMHLHRKHFASVIDPTPSMVGMLTKAKDYITWGTVDDATLKLLYEKRGQDYRGNPDKENKFIKVNSRKLKPYFRLHPPKGGFERGGIKRPFTTGGALGDRKDKIRDLLTRMI
jgi:large subunit ribosomal protein L30